MKPPPVGGLGAVCAGSCSLITDLVVCEYLLFIVRVFHAMCESWNSILAGGHQPSGAGGAAAKPSQPPLFVTVPPRTQKVVHSEAYLR